MSADNDSDATTATTTIVTPDGWSALTRFTAARIALGRSGASLPTQAHLQFQLAHAQARDAVHLAFDGGAHALLMTSLQLPTLQVNSAAADRHTFLQRPDLGRRLDTTSMALLQQQVIGIAPEIVFVIADGLSALAVERNAARFLNVMVPRLRSRDWQIGPLVIAQQGRVAIGDQIGALLQAQMVVVLIGERPGLSSPDSLGLYLTFAPRPGRSDAERNCISNIRDGGLTIADAAHRLDFLLTEARHRQLSGVELKDESESPPLPLGSERNFLLD